MVGEPTVGNGEILYGLRDRCEQHHKEVKISDAALEAAAEALRPHISRSVLA